MGTLDNITYIDTFIQEGQRATISPKNLYETLLTCDEDQRDHIIRIPIGDFFSRYKMQLSEIIQYYNMSDAYFHKPKLLSLEIYGTTELWIALMRLNGYRNITEFRESMIQVYNPDALRELINIFFKREKKIT